MKTAAGMLCLAGILSLGMGTTVFAEDGDSHYPVTITTYNYENEPVEMTFEKAPEKVFAYANSNIEELLALGLGDKIVAACGLDGDVREDLKDEFDSYPLWVAHYLKKDRPRIARNWAFWQYSETGRVSGIRGKVDFNVFNGDSTDFRDLLIE